VGQVEAAPAAAYRPGRPYRMNPSSAQIDNVPLLQGIPVRQAERKVREIHRGAELAQELPAFPEARRCRDAVWVVFFALTVAVLVFGAFHFAGSVGTEVRVKHVHVPAVASLVAAGVAGGAASLVAAMAFALLANFAPGCVVWTSLLFGPVLCIGLGLGLLGTSAAIAGMLLVAIGAICLSFVFCCYWHLIPFMIKVVETVASVMRENPMMLAVSLLGSVVGVAWSLACGLAFAGAYITYQGSIQDSSQGEQYGLYFVAVLIFIWGAQVAYNVCHVTYCGVFSRWYFGVTQGTALRKSLWVALTTSLGSICFGSFLVALIRALEAVVRQARRSAQQDGNAVCCVVLLLLECVISCIGDILEYFSEWAYVQCAVRGASFVQAARITYTMMTCANVYFVVQDLLINSVVNLGALFSVAVGCAAGAGAGFAVDGEQAAVAGGIIGLWAGLVAGGSAVGVLSSGTKTILALWAEDPEPLARKRPQIHAEFEQRILGKFGDQ
jgi:hypothetical protein